MLICLTSSPIDCPMTMKGNTRFVCRYIWHQNRTVYIRHRSWVTSPDHVDFNNRMERMKFLNQSLYFVLRKMKNEKNKKNKAASLMPADHHLRITTFTTLCKVLFERVSMKMAWSFGVLKSHDVPSRVCAQWSWRFFYKTLFRPQANYWWWAISRFAVCKYAKQELLVAVCECVYLCQCKYAWRTISGDKNGQKARANHVIWTSGHSISFV